MIIEETNLKGLFTITPEVLEDNRGYFMELFRKDRFGEHGANIAIVQQNVSFSKKNVIRGLHFQWEPPLGKLVRVIEGHVFAVGADIRKKSLTLGKYFSLELSYENKKGLYLTPGFAYGFCVLSEHASVEYLYTAHYNAKGESGILWSDPTIGVQWPIANPILSAKDTAAQTFEEWLARPESDNF